MLTTWMLVAIGEAAIGGPFEDANDAFKRGDYATALGLLRPLAEQGLAKAQYALGAMYDHGWGVAQNYADALKWYRLAADQDDVLAQNSLGIMYRGGNGVGRTMPRR
jgi:TPR repeat protein